MKKHSTFFKKIKPSASHTHSFSAFIIEVVVLCILIGAVTNAFAAYPGECIYLQGGKRGSSAHLNYHQTPHVDVAAGTMTKTNGDFHSGSLCTNDVSIWYWEDDQWKKQADFFLPITNTIYIFHGALTTYSYSRRMLFIVLAIISAITANSI